METDWQKLPNYEGWQRRIHPINHTTFTHEVMMWREEWPEVTLKAVGSSYEGAIEHSVIRINREISKLGS